MLLGAAIVTSGVTALVAAPTVDEPTVHALDNTPWYLPERPPNCTVEQAESGDVAGCLMTFYADPADTGFGAPPAPGIGEGWNWLGYTYSGSPALAEWEANHIASNTEVLAGQPPGHLETHVDVQDLFEGFLSEISENGYDVYWPSGYSFRCTSGNGGWNCPSGDPRDLSNHAWGLAVDLNSGSNPIRSYERIDGNTACQTPMQTDMPRWMVETAEKWGLYWGGYGWNSGCADTTTERDRVYRDPPHFEFRGTPEMARAIAEFNLRNDPTVTCLTVVDESGDDEEICRRSNQPEAGWRLPVELDVPEGATAAMINLTATGSDGPGYLTLETCEPREAGPRETSALTFAPGESIATMAIVPVDDTGRFCIYRSAAVHSIVDVVGFLAEDEAASWLRLTTPTRLTDTRGDGAPLGNQDLHPIPEVDDSTLLANLAAVDGAGAGYLQAGDCDGLGPEASFSNLNYASPDARSNLSLISAGEAGSCVFALTEAHVIVDELGRFDADEGLGWNVLPPRRVLDTRECSDQWCDDRPEARRMIPLQLGTEAPGVAIAITVTETEGPGYVSVGRCTDMDGLEAPSTSNLNHSADQTVTNLAIVELDEGEMCVFTREAAHVIIDIQAELNNEQLVGLLPVAPHRAHDSRT